MKHENNTSRLHVVLKKRWTPLLDGIHLAYLLESHFSFDWIFRLRWSFLHTTHKWNMPCWAVFIFCGYLICLSLLFVCSSGHSTNYPTLLACIWINQKWAYFSAFVEKRKKKQAAFVDVSSTIQRELQHLQSIHVLEAQTTKKSGVRSCRNNIHDTKFVL